MKWLLAMNAEVDIMLNRMSDFALLFLIFILLIMWVSLLVSIFKEISRKRKSRSIPEAKSNVDEIRSRLREQRSPIDFS